MVLTGEGCVVILLFLPGWLADGKEQVTLLDVENTKITNRCEVLHQLNLSLEEDRKSLMSQVMIFIMMIMMMMMS